MMQGRKKAVGGVRKHPYPTQAEVRKLFSYYESATDVVFCWQQARGSIGAGKKAGCKAAPRSNKEPDRYLVKLNGAMFNVRDLIWIYFYKRLPEGGLKFADGDCWNLRISNIVPRKPVVSFF